MFDRKYMFGDKSTLGSRQNVQNIPKKGQQEKIFFLDIKQGSITHSFNVKKFYFLQSFLKSARFFKGIRE